MNHESFQSSNESSKNEINLNESDSTISEIEPKTSEESSEQNLGEVELVAPESMDGISKEVIDEYRETLSGQELLNFDSLIKLKGEYPDGLICGISESGDIVGKIGINNDTDINGSRWAAVHTLSKNGFSTYWSDGVGIGLDKKQKEKFYTGDTVINEVDIVNDDGKIETYATAVVQSNKVEIPLDERIQINESMDEKRLELLIRHLEQADKEVKTLKAEKIEQSV